MWIIIVLLDQGEQLSNIHKKIIQQLMERILCIVHIPQRIDQIFVKQMQSHDEMSIRKTSCNVPMQSSLGTMIQRGHNQYCCILHW